MYVHPSSSFRQGNGHLARSFCKSEGRGGHEVRLEIGVGQCGWKKEGQKVTLDLYVQYDALVQQVIDEQMTVECDMVTREGRLVTLYEGEGMSIPVRSMVGMGVPVQSMVGMDVPVQSMVQSYDVRQSLVEEEEMEVSETSIILLKLRRSHHLLKLRRSRHLRRGLNI